MPSGIHIAFRDTARGANWQGDDKSLLFLLESCWACCALARRRAATAVQSLPSPAGNPHRVWGLNMSSVGRKRAAATTFGRAVRSRNEDPDYVEEPPALDG
jgi:hypothetical protein